MASKRRASTQAVPSSPETLAPIPKANRPSTSPPSSPTTISRSRSPLIHACTLPPTCQPPIGRPTALPDASALERHYATYHTHVCEDGPCRAVFPEARFLELHQTECHDPLAAVRKERGEKIFACFLSTCPKHFSTPKTRRLHLLQAHAYPKQSRPDFSSMLARELMRKPRYFYNITNYGVGGLLLKYGEGASLIRPDWKPRDAKDDAEMGDNDYDDDDDDEDLKPAAPPARDAPPHLRPQDASTAKEDPDDVDALASTLGNMQIVPPVVRFGRGAAHGGFNSQGGRGGGRHRKGSRSKEQVKSAEKDREEVIAFVPKQVRASRKSNEMKM